MLDFNYHNQYLHSHKISIQGNEHTLYEIKGGLTEKQDLEFYERTDKNNIGRVMDNRFAIDLTLEMLDIKIEEKNTDFVK